MASKPFLAGSGALWFQPDGPNTEPFYLGCHELGGVTVPKGDVTLLYCPDSSQPNQFKVVSSYKGAAGPTTTSLTTDVLETADYLENADDGGTLFVHKIKAGKMNLFANWERSFVFPNVVFTQEALENMAVQEPDSQDRSNQSFEISADTLLRTYRMGIAEQSVSETEDMLGIYFYDKRVGENIVENTYGVAVAAAASGVAANVLLTTDGGATWSAAAADALGADEDIASVIVFEVDRGVNRIMVARGSTDAGNSPEIAYSDDDGAIWTTVDQGSVNALFAQGPKSLAFVDKTHIWSVVDSGNVFFSDDGGVTWTAQQSAAGGQATTQDLNAIHFVDSSVGVAVGTNNAVIQTLDGGTSWTLLTGPSGKSADEVLSVFAFSQYVMWLGYDDGELWYTNDGGTVWSQRTHPLIASGLITDIDFLNDLIGIALHNSSYIAGGQDGTVLFTIDGGFNWEQVTPPDNDGVTSVQMLETYLAFVSGNSWVGTGKVFKVSGG